jgi:hemerythrin-like domain-containing protein
MRALEALVREHRQIERVLASLETLAGRLELGATPEALTGFVEFFRGYADAHHHGKEELILFPAMGRCGLSLESGPLAVMFYDHGEGRRLVGLLADGAHDKDLDAAERAKLAGVARHYAAFLRHHIYKEDTVLFSMVQTQLSQPERRHVEKAFADFDERHEASGWLGLAQTLAEAFPAIDTERDGAEPVGNGCDLHCTLPGCPARDPFGELPWHGGD